jgi:hypothetical protein
MNPDSGDQQDSATPTTKYSGLSGNEMYCAYMLGYTPGNILVGNSVFAMGFIGGIGSNVRTALGRDYPSHKHDCRRKKIISI